MFILATNIYLEVRRTARVIADGDKKRINGRVYGCAAGAARCRARGVTSCGSTSGSRLFQYFIIITILTAPSSTDPVFNGRRGHFTCQEFYFHTCFIAAGQSRVAAEPQTRKPLREQFPVSLLLL